jgi:hypothetical protein
MDHTTTIKEKPLTPRTVDPPRDRTHRDGGEAMEKSQAQPKTEEKIFLGAVMLADWPTNLTAWLSISPVLAILLNLRSFGSALILVVALLIAVSILYQHPTRSCHLCGRRVRLDQRVCRHCGYDFEPIRMTR